MYRLTGKYFKASAIFEALRSEVWHHHAEFSFNVIEDTLAFIKNTAINCM